MAAVRVLSVVGMIAATVCRCGSELSSDGFCLDCGWLSTACKCARIAPVEVSANGHRDGVVEVDVSRRRDTLTSLDELHERFQRYLYLPDLVAVDVAAAVIVAHRSGGDPLWMFLVSPPSSGKTEILQSLTDCTEVYKLSSLTGQTFASGFKGRNSSLLNRLEDRGLSFLLLKDFTTVLSLHRDARSDIMGALREIYDGEYSKDFGNGQTVSWIGRLGFLAGCTPVIDRHHQVLATLGQRFLMLRLPPEDRDTITARSLATRGHEAEMRSELRDAMRSFLDAVSVRGHLLSVEATEHVVAVSRYATQGRTGVERDGYSREILVLPELEVPARFAKAAAALLCGLVAIGYDEARALEVVARVGRDSMPQVRVAVLEQLAGGFPVSTPDLANGTDLPISTVRLVVEDLTAIGLVERSGSGQDLRWTLAADGANTIKALAIGDAK
jgi:hypothetical protein